MLQEGGGSSRYDSFIDYDRFVVAGCQRIYFLFKSEIVRVQMLQLLSAVLSTTFLFLKNTFV